MTDLGSDEAGDKTEPTHPTAREGAPGASAADTLNKALYAAADRVAVWKTPTRKAWATIDGRNVPVASPELREWLAFECYRVGAGTPTRYALDKVVTMLQGKALFAGSQHSVHLRVAGHKGAVWIDLADAKGQAVRLTGDGWEVKNAIATDATGVKFWRPLRMRAFPSPERVEGDPLRPLVNVAGDNDYRLLLTWITAALRPKGPYPVPILRGQQGTAKSETTRIIRALTDPSDVPLHRVPREERDLDAAARNNHVLAIDNVSSVPPWMSDAICRLATGGGMGGRKLYTDADEETFEAQRPVVLNGIANLITRGDLADRALVFDLPPIDPRNRLSAKALEARLQAALSGAFAMLLDAMVAGLKRLPDLEARMTAGDLELPRMADFALWGMAVAPALGWTEDHFLRVYAGKQAEAQDMVLEAEPVAAALTEFIGKVGKWSGTMQELLALLSPWAPANDARRGSTWPKTAAALGTLLRRMEPLLPNQGIAVEHRKSNGRALVVIRPVAPAEEAA